MSYRQQRDNDGLWWQIALGIFVGHLMTAALAGTAMLILGGIAAHEAGRAIQSITRQAPSVYRPARSAQPMARPLGDDERCIQGKRFRRLSNGWQELPHDPC